ncbi:MAG: hypothetical protein JW944_10795 [Deltaproteobacteria bacterium]|nr:hypothetical protein [Deltaproteobacteria bacterium]
MKFYIKNLTVLLSIVFLLVWTTPTLASEGVWGIATPADILVVRPLGVAATLVGTAIFIVSMPFSAPSGSISKVADEIVLKPARFTFKRPVGYFSKMEP